MIISELPPIVRAAMLGDTLVAVRWVARSRRFFASSTSRPLPGGLNQASCTFVACLVEEFTRQLSVEIVEVPESAPPAYQAVRTEHLEGAQFEREVDDRDRSLVVDRPEKPDRVSHVLNKRRASA